MTAGFPVSTSMWLALALTTAVIGMSIAVVAREVARDGYGAGEPPRSHRSDVFEPARPRPEVQLPSAQSTSRAARLLIGLALYGVAIALIVHARLGVSPWDVFAQGVALRTGLPFGLVTNGIGAALLLLWWPLRQRPGIGTVVNVLLVGTVAQLALDALPVVEAIPVRVGLFVCGLLLLAVATGLYVGAGLGAGPRDGLMLGVHRRFGLPIWLARTLIEGSVLVAGGLLGGDVGIGTVVFAAAIGPLCGVTIPRFAPKLAGAPGSIRWRRALPAVDDGRAARSGS